MTVLARLVRFHRHRLDEKRRVLRELQDRSAAIEGRIAALEDSMVSEGKSASRMRDTMGDYGNFVRAALDRRVLLLDELREANAAVEAARDELLELFAEMKRFEISLDHHQQQERLALERRIQEALDEAALNLHRRRHAS